MSNIAFSFVVLCSPQLWWMNSSHVPTGQILPLRERSAASLPEW